MYKYIYIERDGNREIKREREGRGRVKTEREGERERGEG